MRLFHRPSSSSGHELEPELRTLEAALLRYRPPAPRHLVDAIARPTEIPPRRSARWPQLATAAGFTALLATALSAVGGVSYAANAVTHAAQTARQVLVTHVTVVGKGITAGGDQYEPGFGFGDPNHSHDGPPGVTDGKPGQKAPPAQVAPARDGKAFLATGTITVDEQAALYFSVLDSSGKQLLLTQRGSHIGGKVEGPQVKTIHYVMLVPRTIPVQIRVPKNLLHQGQTYRIRIIAVDPQGNKTISFISFAA
jgi:hypothetical protein